ncbi:MAG: hypothetical protein OEY48_03850 [Gammaproteobacteria bacterium]|nr:hypothetical protein [Gammaproteobacteria bacterium]MDH5591960.1 hypothetical protein [Gammaproteobacteria bacterium]
MQINGAHLAATFLPKPTDCQESFSTPVIIEAAARRDEKLLTPIVVNERTNQLTATFNDVQRSRFVRMFAMTNDSSANNEYRPQSSVPAMPRGVQHYLQVADMKSGSDNDRLFDETV